MHTVSRERPKKQWFLQYTRRCLQGAWGTEGKGGSYEDMERDEGNCEVTRFEGKGKKYKSLVRPSFVTLYDWETEVYKSTQDAYGISNKFFYL